MPWWLSTLGAVLTAIATLLIAWSALRPRQRTYARLLASLWIQRGAIALVVSFFVWVNVSFLMKSGPVGRLEILVLIVANAEALLLLIVFLLVKLMNLILDKRNERWQKVADRLEKLEKSRSVSTEPAAVQRDING